MRYVFIVIGFILSVWLLWGAGSCAVSKVEKLRVESNKRLAESPVVSASVDTYAGLCITNQTSQVITVSGQWEYLERENGKLKTSYKRTSMSLPAKKTIAFAQKISDTGEPKFELKISDASFKLPYYVVPGTPVESTPDCRGSKPYFLSMTPENKITVTDVHP